MQKPKHTQAHTTPFLNYCHFMFDRLSYLKISISYILLLNKYKHNL
jgi:hypothetical protein